MKNKSAFIKEYNSFVACEPTLRYKGDIPFEQWQMAAREKLLELLGLPLERCEDDFELEYEKACDGYTDYRFTVQTEPDYYVPCHLLVPEYEGESIEATLCLMGHSMGMHIGMGVALTERDIATLEEWPERALALCAVRQGRAAILIESRNMGESSVTGYGVSCTEAAKVAFMQGRTALGERIWDAMRIIDAAEKHFPFLDLSRLICTGNSGGGTVTYYLSCLDERIKISAPCCAVCEFENSIAAMEHCLCNHVPFIKKYFEMGDLGGMIAPRKLVVTAGEIDDIFPIEGTKKSFERIKSLYKAAGAEGSCHLVIGDNGHYYYGARLWEKVNEII